MPVKSSIRGINDRTNPDLPKLQHGDQAHGVLGGAADRHTRRRYETQLAQKEAEVAAREAAIRDQQEKLACARQEIDVEVATRLDQERGKIAVAEALKAKRLVETDLDARAKEIADLNEVLRRRDTKLAEAQQAQADLIRKQRELDDAKRAMDLTIENRVQA